MTPRRSRWSGRTRLLIPLLVVVALSAAGYLITTESIDRDREDAAMRRAQLDSIRAQGVLSGARAYVVGLANALASEPAPSAHRFAQLQGTAAGSVGLTDAFWVVDVSEGGQPHPRAKYVTGTAQTGIRPGTDVARYQPLAAALRDPASVFSVSATRPVATGGHRGFFVLQAARFGRGRAGRGFLVVFAPRGWLTVGLSDAPGRVAVSIDKQPLEGVLDTGKGATSAFESLSRRWSIAVDREPSTELQEALPWLALFWPMAAAALVYLIARGVSRGRRAEREVERIFNLSVDLLSVANFDGYFTRVNPAFEHTLGYTTAELLGRPFNDFVHPDDRVSTADAMASLSEGHDVIQFENRYVKKDGTVCWLQWTSRPVPDERLIYGAARDITESRKADAELRQSRRDLARLADGQAALRRVATLVARDVPVDDVLAAVGHEVHQLVRPDVTLLYRFERDGTCTAVAAQGFRSPVEPGFQWDPGPDWTTAAAIRAGFAAEELEAVMATPVMVGGRLWGMLAVASRDTQLPDEAHDRLREFAEIAGIAIASAESRADLSASRARVVAAADETRRKIERDLHDGTQQRIVVTRARTAGDEHRRYPRSPTSPRDSSETARWPVSS